jgi:CRP-like cAMP-binding protein
MPTDTLQNMNSKDNNILKDKINGLAELSDVSSNKLFKGITKREIAKGQNILTEGQTCTKIVFIEKGGVRTFFVKDGNEVNLDFTFENDFVTNLKSLRTASPSQNNIQTIEKTTVYEIEKDSLFNLYKESPEIESFGRKLLEQLLIKQEEHANLFKIYSSTERYYYLLENKPDYLQRISLSQIASYLGVTRETLSRIRKKKS